MNGPSNEFPVRLSLDDIAVIAHEAERTIDTREFIKLNIDGASARVIMTIEVLRSLQQFLLNRRVDPGFQVVLGE